MNERNRALFFDESSNEVVTIRISDENGNEIDAEIMAALEVEETGKEYMAVMPSAPIRGFEQGEAILLAYDEVENGDPLFEALSDPEEFEIATNAFEELFASASEIENSSLH